ncbi:dUTP diphosphatase [Heyndrickxia sporothermodurans]|uniref:dUTP diphosphatase n=1 Tax=Heyndrickxia sporothermodurans TaxID=46224 RepID=UPI0035DAA1CC
MNLDKMLAAQAELDKHIVGKKGLQGVDLVPNTFLALQVELAEFANEGRWFKHWSDDQEPRTKVPVTAWGEPYKNPLLEEYVDCVHFFLSIANQKGWQDALYIYEEAVEDLREDGFDGGLTGIFLEMLYFLNKCQMEREADPEKDYFQKVADVSGLSRKAYIFNTAWYLFVCIGLIGFNFTPEQIEEAYFAKHKINYQRQDSGFY